MDLSRLIHGVFTILVGNVDWNDARAADGSSFGFCLTLFAPESSMTVASKASDTAIAHGGEDEAGSSYSAPLVAATITTWVTQQRNKSPATMVDFLVSNSARNIGLKNLIGSHDVLLQNPTISTNLK
ncbi:hypothetical protein DFH09DRAFT_1314705 [Mycena vulgaris]|nr:hypothetical protein DFH09DRAFT_1314705 [Mycena vulgaris]